jgi:hypothetical protein
MLADNVLRGMVNTYHGYCYATAGMLFGFFEDPDDAKQVAVLITGIGGHVAVIGCQIVVTL